MKDKVMKKRRGKGELQRTMRPMDSLRGREGSTYIFVQVQGSPNS